MLKPKKSLLEAIHMPGEHVCDSSKCCSTEFYEVDSITFTDREADSEEELVELSAQTTSTAG